MVRWMASMRVKAGKSMKAMGYAKEMVEFAKKFKGAPAVHVYGDSFGDIPTIRWFVDYPDLATLETVGNQVLADEAYHKKVEQNADLFVEGSTQVVVMSEI